MADRILLDLYEKESVKLISLIGGSGASNAICRDAEAVFSLPVSRAEQGKALVGEWRETLKNENKTGEPGLTVSLEETGKSWKKA